MLRRTPALALLFVACSAPGGETQETATGTASGPATGTSTTEAVTTGVATTGMGTTGVATTGVATTGVMTTGVVTTGVATTEVGTSGGTTEAESTTGGEEPAGPRYDEVRQKSSHNSFQRHEALFDQMVYHRVRSLELDIHVGKSLKSPVAGDWYVYHTDIIDDDTKCELLSQCLGQIAALEQALPEHEVVTVWIDLKDGFDATHLPEDLDARLSAAFGERLLRPAELLAACPGATTLQAAVTTRGCAWPRLSQLRGRVVVALTGGGLDDPGGALATYVGGDPAGRAALVAPALTDAEGIDDHPEAILHNLAFADVALAMAVRAAGMVSRVWVADNANAWSAAEQAGVHHIATNKISISALVDPWASTAGPGGWPFRCIDDCAAPMAEVGATVAVEVDSGDLWGKSDDGVFARVEVGEGAIALTAAISTPSSHVEPWVKACLGARAGLGADAAYLAVCRHGDDHPLRVQVRMTAGAEAEAIALPGLAGLSAESPAFVRLERLGDGSCARGLGSADGVTWTTIAERCFAGPLAEVGLLASSHGEGPVRMLFVDLQAMPGGAFAAGSLTVSGLGSGVGAVHDGL